MFIALEDGTQLRGDGILKAVLRYDLTPIPSTVELTIRSGEAAIDDQLIEGNAIQAGRDSDLYRIVKVQRRGENRLTQGDTHFGSTEVIALLDACHKVGFLQSRAIIKEAATLGDVYRSCGAQPRVKADLSVSRFASLVGDVPTFGIAQALQEEACVPVWRDSGLSFLRIDDVMAQDPVLQFGDDVTAKTASQYLERQSVPWAFSTDSAGAFVFGDQSKPRVSAYLPRAAERVLRNMSRALVVRRIFEIGYAGELVAGDVVQISGVKHVVLTAAHIWQNDSDGQNQITRIWVATP